MYDLTKDRLPLQLLAKHAYTYDVEIYLTDDDKGITGGYKANWTVNPTELAQASYVKFHIYEWPYDADEDYQFEQISKLPESSKEIPAPELI